MPKDTQIVEGFAQALDAEDDPTAESLLAESRASICQGR